MCITSSQNRSYKTNKISPQLSTTEICFPQVIQSKIAVNNIFFLTVDFLWIVENQNYLPLSSCFYLYSFPQNYPQSHLSDLEFVV